MITHILDTLEDIEDKSSFIFYQKESAMGKLYTWKVWTDGRLEITDFSADEVVNLCDILTKEGVLITFHEDPYCFADNYIQQIDFEVMEGSLWWQRVVENQRRKV